MKSKNTWYPNHQKANIPVNVSVSALVYFLSLNIIEQTVSIKAQINGNKLNTNII